MEKTELTPAEAAVAEGESRFYFQNMTGFNAASISALGGPGKGGQPNGQNGTVQLQQQVGNAFPDVGRSAGDEGRS